MYFFFEYWLILIHLFNRLVIWLTLLYIHMSGFMFSSSALPHRLPIISRIENSLLPKAKESLTHFK